MACMSEGDLRPEVEWAVRRWRGEGIDAIASSAGVAPSVVRAATGPIGPFPSDGRRVSDAEIQAWVELRQAGASIDSVAGHFGVAPSTVMRRTAGKGPYSRRAPKSWTSEQRDRWIAQRRARVTIVSIAAAEGVSKHVVTEATRSTTPFINYRRPPDGYVGIAGLAALSGVTPESAIRWRDLGYLPEPEGSHRGHPTWRVESVEAWLPLSGMGRCPECGAWSRAPAVHRGHAHQKRGAAAD